jgi:hypothetical protein
MLNDCGPYAIYLRYGVDIIVAMVTQLRDFRACGIIFMNVL